MLRVTADGVEGGAEAQAQDRRHEEVEEDQLLGYLAIFTRLSLYQRIIERK